MTQGEALSILKTGANVFLTGEPGSGKTYTVNLYIQYLREHGVGVAVTASTGIAATHIGGMTIHSWSGIGIKKSLSTADIAKLHSNRRLASRAQRTSVLIIDEVSMLDVNTLEVVDIALKSLRENEEPFGGMQTVFVGDFFQLPPVTREEEEFSGFAFESPAWHEASPIVCYLSEQYRQEDTEFLELLSAIRRGENTASVYSFLVSRTVEAEFTQVHTRLYSHNVDVDRVNTEKLKSLYAEEYRFQMTASGAKPLIKQLKKSCLSPEMLVLKRGARVMFTKNDFEEGFVNGTLGEVIGFDNDVPVVVIKSGREINVSPAEWEVNDGLKTLATITQFPLRLAWAITVHKSQGMTLDAAVVDLTRAFEYSQGYVALSRIRSLSGLFLLGINRKALDIHPGVFEIDEVFRENSDNAQRTYAKLSDKDLSNRHRSYLVKCGGKVGKSTSKKSYSVDSIRKKNKNAYKPWSEKEEKDLLRHYQAGKKPCEIANELGRQPGAIRSRLTKLGS